MSRAEIRMEQEREQMLNELITKYGFESYFAKYAWKDLYNSRIYFETAINWHFIED